MRLCKTQTLDRLCESSRAEGCGGGETQDMVFELGCKYLMLIWSSQGIASHPATPVTPGWATGIKKGG